MPRCGSSLTLGPKIRTLSGGKKRILTFSPVGDTPGNHPTSWSGLNLYPEDASPRSGMRSVT